MPEFSDILKRIDEAIVKFNKVIPGIQKDIFSDMQEQLKRLDTSNGKIKTTVANLKVVASIKNKLLGLILTPEYKKEVKEFTKAFNDVTTLQNQYWQSVEKEFKPRALLKEIRTQAIADTVKSLTASGIGSTIQEQISDILRTNITTGGSYAALNDQLRESLVNTKTDGLLLKYTKQITTDSINQYSAQYTQTVSNDLGFEWFAYQGSDIKTTRPFCDAMTDFRYFHVTEIPDLLKAKDLYYVKDGEKTKVPIYNKTGLPHGMIPGTNPANFQINRGGYNCGHQIRPVSESLVPFDRKEDAYSKASYSSWKGDEASAKAIEQREEIKPVPETKKEGNLLKITKAEDQRIEKINEKGKRPYDLENLVNDSNESFGFLMKPDNENINKMMIEHPELKREELVAISMYGNTTYRKLNSVLRHEAQDEAGFEFQKNFEKLLNEALNKIPSHDGVVYRGGNFDRITLDAYKEAFQNGTPITEKAFTSTSKSVSSAFEGDTFFIIKSKNGKAVEKIMEFGAEGGVSEQEVLFKSQSKFKVTTYKTEKANGKKRTLIKLEEI